MVPMYKQATGSSDRDVWSRGERAAESTRPGPTSHWTEPNEASAIWSVNIASPGVVQFDFSNFTGFDFTQIDEMTMNVESQLAPGISVSVGPIRTGANPTPSRSTTWGG